MIELIWIACMGIIFLSMVLFMECAKFMKQMNKEYGSIFVHVDDVFPKYFENHSAETLFDILKKFEKN